MIVPFELPFSQAAVDDLRLRLERTRWPGEIPGVGWDYGFSLPFLQDLCAYWKDSFDWQAQLARMAQFRHYRFVAGNGLGIHFIHERGRGPSPIPLILTHGWPGSFLEMLRIIPMLTDRFDVVVPSLPGYGFSDRPDRRGVNTFAVAGIWVELMQALGYSRFAAQGGDIGAGVSTILGLRHPGHVLGIHLNYIPASYRPHVESGPPLNSEEKAFLREAARWFDDAGAYAHLQRTQPQTAAYGLHDSPAALAAWLVEKFRNWSDCEGDVYRRFTRDELLSQVTLYWMTETIGSSFRMYYESARAPLQLGSGERIGVPCAVARFPKEAPFPPRCWVERGYNVRRWTALPAGGHFAAAEEPESLAADLREFFESVR